jgi:uncharacterized short protein YbdD (DUF466 family)
MSRSMPSPADADFLPRSLPARGWRAACRALARWWRAGAQTARLAIGIPDYDNYVDHVRRRHPDRTPMGRNEFFHERMLARYGKGRSRCC